MLPLTFIALALVGGQAGHAAPGNSYDQRAADWQSQQLAMIQDRVRQDGSVRLLIELAMPYSAERARAGLTAFIQRQRIAQVQRQVLDQLDSSQIAAERRYRNVPLMAVEVRESGLQVLVQSHQVARIHLDEAVPPTLSESIPLIGADDVWSAGYDGAGQLIAVLDTGVDVDHSAFSGRVFSEACFSTTSSVNGSTTLCPNGEEEQFGVGAAEPCSISVCDHGTHVAGIALGEDATITGVAKGAQLIAIQVFSEFTGSACGGDSDPCVLSYTSDQLAALDWLYTNRDDLGGVLAAANLSLGTAEVYSDYCDVDARTEIITVLRIEGIATVIAAGNGASSEGISKPACISSAISVGSTNKSDSVSGFSNAASIMSLFAPGSSIYSSVPEGYGTKSGTSMAAPHVAGIMALLGQHSPATSLDERFTALLNSGVLVQDTRTTDGVTKPRAQVEAAIEALQPTPTPTATPTASRTPTATATGTATASSTATPTPSTTPTASKTPTPTATSTPSNTPTQTATPSNTPTPSPTPVFGDVPASHWAYDEINALFQANYIAGCSSDPRLFCPDNTMNRAESAVFVVRGVHGGGTLPPNPTSKVFDDVALSAWYAKWAHALWEDGYTAGCSADPLKYCPNQGHTRAEGTVFYLRMLNGPDFVPPEPTSQTFADVPLSAWYAKWVQAAWDANLILACQTSPELRYCPDDPLDRATAAYMMVQAKGGLPLP